jgi:hypothetical protein
VVREEAIRRGSCLRKEVNKLIEAQKIRPIKREAFLTNRTVATHLWCPFRVKRYFPLLGEKIGMAYSRTPSPRKRLAVPHRRPSSPLNNQDSVLPPTNNADIIRHYKTTKTAASMITEEVTCRVLVIKPYGNDDDVSLAEKSARVCLKDCLNTAIETRLLWARAIAKEFSACSKRYDSIRPWEFILNLDGTVDCLAVPPSKSHHDKVYPARFRIPPNTLLRLGQEEKNKRSEMFALGSLLYEINSGNKPFEELSDDEVQLRFSIFES